MPRARRLCIFANEFPFVLLLIGGLYKFVPNHFILLGCLHKGLRDSLNILRLKNIVIHGVLRGVGLILRDPEAFGVCFGEVVLLQLGGDLVSPDPRSIQLALLTGEHNSFH